MLTTTVTIQYLEKFAMLQKVLSKASLALTSDCITVINLMLKVISSTCNHSWLTVMHTKMIGLDYIGIK